MKKTAAFFTGYFEDGMIDKIMEGLGEDFSGYTFQKSKDKKGNVSIYVLGVDDEDELTRIAGFIHGIKWFYKQL